MKNKPNKILRLLSNKRIYILALIGFGFFYGVFVYHLSLWIPLAVGSVLGLIFGKVFCRWACPMGLLMEVMMGLGGDNAAKMYQYHKLGCPIAWISGWLNKFSFFKIKMNSESCLNCGKCDKACYLSSLEPAKFSLYKPKLLSPGENYACSKCLQCVAACPNGSLTYKFK